MLENKYAKILLLIAVVVIYSTLFVKWKNYTKNEVVTASNIPTVENLLHIQVTDTSYIISEKNPFDENVRPRKSRITSKSVIKKKSTSGKKDKREKSVPRISFHGSVKSSNSKKYYVKINGHLRELQIGKAVEGIKLITVKKDIAVFSIHNKIHEIPLNLDF